MSGVEERGVPKRGLLYRLSAAETPEAPTDAIESIVANLRSILNSDRGISISAPDLGLSLHRMLSDWNVRQAEILSDIGDTLERYEPRLCDVEVKALGEITTFRLSILIQGRLADGQTLQFRTEMSASGAAEVHHIVQEV